MDWYERGWGNDRKKSLPWYPCMFAFETKEENLLMMKTKGKVEKRNGISWNHYAKVLLNERPGISSVALGMAEKESWNAGEIQTVNFLLFSLYEKRDFYSNSSHFLAFLQTAEDFLRKKRRQRNRAGKYKWHFDYFQSFIFGLDLDPK